MPARVVDGEGIWRSKKIKLMRPEFRAEYANLLPLSDSRGVFRSDPRFIWSKVYCYNRSNITPEIVEKILEDLQRVGLLEVKDGKGYWLALDTDREVVKSEFWEKQGQQCAICRCKTPGKRGWCLDHNHKTGRVRGVLCGKCNRGLGLLQDSPELLLRAREYLLEEFKEDHGPIWRK